MLPSKPKIFHGREVELEHIVEIFDQDLPRIAILGGGGMGKTSLARAALHHPEIAAKFEHRFFVSAESATTSIELAALIGLHLGIGPGQDLTKAVVQYFSKQSPSLLILDNLETPWEPMHCRPGVEEFLSLLTDVAHLALIVCLIWIILCPLLRLNRSQCEAQNGLGKSAGLVHFYCHCSRCRMMQLYKLS
jgi:hypothetical protein